MKDLKSILTQRFSIGTALVFLPILFMAVPAFESIRTSLAAQIGLNTPTGLWIPVFALTLGAQALFFRLSLKSIAHPFKKLASNAQHSEQGFAFKTKSRSKEEDTIKHAIESHCLKATESQQLANELEGEVEQYKARCEKADAALEKLGSELEKANQAATQFRIENETLKGSKLALELTLENERKSKVGAEVEKRTEEIYAQMERAVSAAACKAVWIPSLVQELKNPIHLINQISGRLQNTCNQTPLAQIAEQVELIYKQSETQLQLIQGILDKQVSDFPSLDQGSEGSAAQPEPSPEAEILFELEEEEAPQEILEIGLSSKETSVAATAPCDLESLLQSIAKEFSTNAPDCHISYELDRDLDIEIEDETLVSLIKSLVAAGLSLVKEGELIIGADLQPNNLLIDIACEGELRLIDSPDLNKAQKQARSLQVEIEFESNNENELHLAFAYPFGASESKFSISDPIEAPSYQIIDD